MTGVKIKESKLKRSRRFNRFLMNYGGWAFIIPSFILFLFFVWEPMGYGIVLAFSKMQGFTITGFAGFENFKFVFTHPYFSKAMLNTIQYVVFSMLIGYLVPILLAIIVNEVVHGQRFFKVVVYFPALVPSMASLLMWQFLLTAGDEGLVNNILMALGLEPLMFFQNSDLTIFWLVIIMTWKSAGSTTMVYLASLQGINNEIYEAAELDGAGIFAKLRYITVPGIYNTARLMLIMQIISVFQILYEPMVMTGGGPNNASLSLMLLSYNFAFENFQFNNASVVGLVVTAILLVLTLIYLKFVKEQDA